MEEVGCVNTICVEAAKSLYVVVMYDQRQPHPGIGVRLFDGYKNGSFFKRVVYKTTLLLYDDFGKRFPENLFHDKA